MARRRFEVLEKFIQMMFGYMNFFTQCYETFRDIEPFMRTLMVEVWRLSSSLFAGGSIRF